jgi:hypothetical protein
MGSISGGGSRGQSRISCRQFLRNGLNQAAITACGQKIGGGRPVLRPQARSPHDGRGSSSRWHLPGDALIEFEVRCRLGLRVELALPGISHLPQRRATGRWVRISRPFGGASR